MHGQVVRAFSMCIKHAKNGACLVCSHNGLNVVGGLLSLSCVFVCWRRQMLGTAIEFMVGSSSLVK